MSKVKPSWGKLSLVTVISLGFMVLGIGCIAWVMFNMWAQPNYSDDATSSLYYAPTTFDLDLNRLTRDSIDSMKLDHSSDNLNPDKTSPPDNTEKGVNVKSDPSLITPSQDKIVNPAYSEEGDNIGSLTIPTLNRKLPIIQGTGVNSLKKGVGHFTQSVFPGQEDNCVLSGHRDTVFKQLDKLKIGDQLIVQTSDGRFTYEVNGTRIVHKNDKTVIVPTDHAVLTLTTCYPFNTPGYYPDRYIVSATLLKRE